MNSRLRFRCVGIRENGFGRDAGIRTPASASCLQCFTPKPNRVQTVFRSRSASSFCRWLTMLYRRNIESVRCPRTSIATVTLKSRAPTSSSTTSEALPRLSDPARSAGRCYYRRIIAPLFASKASTFFRADSSFGLSARASLSLFVSSRLPYVSSTCCSAHSNLASLFWSLRSKS